MIKYLFVTALIASTTFTAQAINPEHQIGSVETYEVRDYPRNKQMGSPYSSYGGSYGFDQMAPDPISQAGQVIQVARDVVALGEAIYTLVQKGKPTNVTEYAPISVVPREPGTKEPVDAFDLENFSMPVARSFVSIIKNGVGKEVVNFKYKVVYSYGGSYNGTGKYLAGVIIVPSSVTTKYGWDFNASMKLYSIMNHGTKANPIAGILLTLKYQMNSWGTAFERNDTIHITGAGALKKLDSK